MTRFIHPNARNNMIREYPMPREMPRIEAPTEEGTVSKRDDPVI